MWSFAFMALAIVMTSDSSTTFKPTIGKDCCSAILIVEPKRIRKQTEACNSQSLREESTYTCYIYIYMRSRWNEGMYKRRGLFVSRWLCVSTGNVPWHGMAWQDTTVNCLIISNTRIKASRQQWKDCNGDHKMSEIWMKMWRIMFPL